MPVEAATSDYGAEVDVDTGDDPEEEEVDEEDDVDALIEMKKLLPNE